MERVRFSRPRRALHAGRYRRALAELLARPEPDDPSWWRLLAWARWHLGDPEGIRDAERAARMASGSVSGSAVTLAITGICGAAIGVVSIASASASAAGAISGE